MPDQKYPVGEFTFDRNISQERRNALIDEFSGLVDTLRPLLRGLSDAQLDTPYREGGWTVRQLVHHMADSSMNWYIRFKLALTEQIPQVKPFDQDAWSGLADARTLAPDLSVGLLNSVHARMTAVLHSLKSAEFQRMMKHPERGEISVDYTLQTLHWHTKHHIAHIAAFRKRAGW